MTINPRPDQEEKIQEAIQAGLIDSPEEVLDVGLDSLRDRLLKSTEDRSPIEAAMRLANFGKRHNLSLGEIKVTDLIHEGRP